MSSKSPETETFVSTTPTSRGATRGVTTGTLRKLASKLYIRLIDPPQNVVRRNLWAIVAGFYSAVDSLLTWWHCRVSKHALSLWNASSKQVRRCWATALHDGPPLSL